MHTTLESNTSANNPILISEVQALKDRIEEHSKKLEHSAEKLPLLEAKNLVFQKEKLSSQQKNKEETAHVSYPHSTYAALETPAKGGNTIQRAPP